MYPLCELIKCVTQSFIKERVTKEANKCAVKNCVIRTEIIFNCKIIPIQKGKDTNKAS